MGEHTAKQFSNASDAVEGSFSLPEFNVELDACPI
jgi:hypothetical protein